MKQHRKKAADYFTMDDPATGSSSNEEQEDGASGGSGESAVRSAKSVQQTPLPSDPAAAGDAVASGSQDVGSALENASTRSRGAFQPFRPLYKALSASIASIPARSQTSSQSGVTAPVAAPSAAVASSSRQAVDITAMERNRYDAQEAHSLRQLSLMLSSEGPKTSDTTDTSSHTADAGTSAHVPVPKLPAPSMPPASPMPPMPPMPPMLSRSGTPVFISQHLYRVTRLQYVTPYLNVFVGTYRARRPPNGLAFVFFPETKSIHRLPYIGARFSITKTNRWGVIHAIRMAVEIVPSHEPVLIRTVSTEWCSTTSWSEEERQAMLDLQRSAAARSAHVYLYPENGQRAPEDPHAQHPAEFRQFIASASNEIFADAVRPGVARHSKLQLVFSQIPLQGMTASELNKQFPEPKTPKLLATSTTQKRSRGEQAVRAPAVMQQGAHVQVDAATAERERRICEAEVRIAERERAVREAEAINAEKARLLAHYGLDEADSLFNRYQNNVIHAAAAAAVSAAASFSFVDPMASISTVPFEKLIKEKEVQVHGKRPREESGDERPCTSTAAKHLKVEP